MQLTTDRLCFRPLTSNHANAVFAYRCDAETNAFQSWVPRSIKDVQTWLEGCADAKFNQPGNWSQLGIFTHEDNQLIGDVGIHFIAPENNQVELGITLAKEAHHQGFASETIKAVVAYCFGTLNKHRITASIDPENTASINLFSRIGFTKEAHFRKSLFFKGRWVDDIIYAILQEDWNKRKEHV